MREDRKLGELPELRASSFKVALGVAGAVIGLGLVVCGGVAGYVALSKNAPSEPALPQSGTMTADPEKIRQIADRIFRVDVPPGFEPFHGDDDPAVKRALFVRPARDGAILKMVRAAGARARRIGDSPVQRDLFLKTVDLENDPARKLPRALSESEATRREMTVLGNPAVFLFSNENVLQDGKSVRKVTGVFRTQAGPAVLIYTIPAAEFDEQQVIRLIESIRQPLEESIEP